MWFMHGIQGELEKFDEVEYSILCICLPFFFVEKVLRAFYQLFKMIHDYTQKSIRNSCAYVIFGLDLVEEEGRNEFCSAGSTSRLLAILSGRQLPVALILCEACGPLPRVSSFNTMRATQV